MNSILEEKALLDYITEDLEVITLHESDKGLSKTFEEWKEVLIKHIADDQLGYIKDQEMAKDIYDSLEAIFERRSVANQLLLRKELALMKYDGIADMNHYLLQFDKTTYIAKIV